LRGLIREGLHYIGVDRGIGRVQGNEARCGRMARASE
jgi:hypothetical protein